MSAPRPVLIAIARAVEAVGGDLDDARDLTDCWERIHSQPEPEPQHHENRPREKASR